MEQTTQPTADNLIAWNPSLDDLRKELADPSSETKPATPEVEAKPTEKAPPAETKNTESEPGTEKDKQQPESVKEDEEPEIPKNVQKKLEKIAAATAHTQSLIDRATSAKKAKEAELAKLTADKPGSEPAPTTESAAKDSKPVRPQLVEPDIETFPGNLGEFNAATKKARAEHHEALAKYETEHEAWLVAETRRTVEKELTDRQVEANRKRDWEEAIKTHGADFPERIQPLIEATTPDFQSVVSGLENWSGVAVHLAKNPSELKALAEKFEANPVAAIAELGRIEERLKQAAIPPVKEKPAAKEEKPLSPPPPKVGGAATATAVVDLNTASQAEFNREIKRQLAG